MRTFLESIIDEPEQEEEENFTLKYSNGSILITCNDFNVKVYWYYTVNNNKISIYNSEVISNGINATLRDKKFEPVAKQIFKSISNHFGDKKFAKSSDLSADIKTVIRSAGILEEMIEPGIQSSGNMTPASPDSYTGKPVKTCPKCYGEGCKKCKGTGRLNEEFWNTFIISRSMGRTEVPVYRNPTKSETETNFRQVSYDRGILDRKGVLYAWSGELDALHEDMSQRMRIPLGAREGMSVDEMNLGLYMMPLEGLVEVSLYKSQIDKSDLKWAKQELSERVKSSKNVKRYMGSEFKVGFTFAHHKSRYGTGIGEATHFHNYLKESITDEPEQEELGFEEKGIRVGSRVMALDSVGQDSLYKQTGTVLWVGPVSKYEEKGGRQIGVEFDKDIGGHDLFGAVACPIKGKNGHCWFMNEGSLKLIQGTGPKPKKLSLEDQIEYLELFIHEWEKADRRQDKKYESDLIDQYAVFTKMNGLPKMSADELLHELKGRKK